MKRNNFYFIYQVLFGKIEIVENNNKIIAINFKPELNGIMMETELIKETHHQIDEYFNGFRKNFDIPYHLDRKEFSLKVLNALKTILYGEVKSYKDIAIKIKSPKAFRAVGGACNKNPLPLIIPCHRVIGTSGKLVGYAGGLEIKKYLLELEKNNQ